MLLSLYTVAFLAYVGICWATDCSTFWWLVSFAILLRLVLLPLTPNLSDDVYRFIWDGRLLAQGIDPFAFLPAQIIELDMHEGLRGINESLFSKLNSPQYFTIYPPVNQAVFALSAIVFPDSLYGSIILIRLCLLLAEAGSLYLLYRLLQAWQLPTQKMLLYALNPLVILELAGNLHFEALMIFFLLLSFLLLAKQWQVLSAVCLALAIGTKLLPLIILPLYWRRLGTVKAWRYYLFTAGFLVLLFLPLLSWELWEGLGQSIGLYFQKFEFNASIYYVVREVGFAIKGYNIIGTAGKWLAAATFLAIIIFSWFERKKQLPVACMWVWLIYLSLATTVHPWYLTPILALSVFSSYRFVLLWTYLVFFSYAGYSATGFHENLWVTGLAYGLLLAYLVYELTTASIKKA